MQPTNEKHNVITVASYVAKKFWSPIRMDKEDMSPAIEKQPMLIAGAHDTIGSKWSWFDQRMCLKIEIYQIRYRISQIIFQNTSTHCFFLVLHGSPLPSSRLLAPRRTAASQQSPAAAWCRRVVGPGGVSTVSTPTHGGSRWGRCFPPLRSRAEGNSWSCPKVGLFLKKGSRSRKSSPEKFRLRFLLKWSSAFKVAHGEMK